MHAGIKEQKRTGGFYLHFPFCRTKCMYCDFYSVTDSDALMDRFISAMEKEIAGGAAMDHSWDVDTIYLGGGTPSLMEPSHLERLIAALDQAVGIGGVKEFTLEANPGEAPQAKLKAFRSMGVNRLSLGAQTFRSELVTFLGRLHTPEDTIRTFDHARSAGFENISLDLIFNIPGQSVSMWQSDLEQAVSLEPEHVSAYSLTVEKGTELGRRVAARTVTMPEDDEDAAQFQLTRIFLAQKEYAPYEVSNFARPGYACGHNLHYWHIDPYHKAGPAAHGFDGIRRAWNVRSLDDYIRRIEGGTTPESGAEVLTPAQVANERLAFGIRLAEGIDVVETLGYPSVTAFVEAKEAVLQRWTKELALETAGLKLTERGVMLADAIAADLMEPSVL